MSNPASQAARRKRLTQVRADAAGCRRCDLWKRATQTVFGEGPSAARVMLVGEQPGDQEDLAGEPFVGPAGRLLRDALVEAGLDPAEVYLTNAVKHFKWKAGGKRRIHDRPNREQVLACRMWLDEEIEIVRPKMIIALGATAAGTLLGSGVRVSRDRGRWFPSTLAPAVSLTVHPSSLLRIPDSAARKTARSDFIKDLKTFARKLSRMR